MTLGLSKQLSSRRLEAASLIRAITAGSFRIVKSPQRHRALSNKGIEILDRDTAVDLVYSDVEYFGDRSGYWAVPNVKQSLRNYGEANRARVGGYRNAQKVRRTLLSGAILRVQLLRVARVQMYETRLRRR